MKKVYKKPTSNYSLKQIGLPTVLAVGAVSAAVGAASVAVGKLVGSISPLENSENAFLNGRIIFTEGFQ